MRLSFFVFLLIVSGCANTGVVEISPGNYLLSKQDNAGIFGNFPRFKMEVIQEANEYAKARGKVAIPISMHETPAIPGRFATFQYQFRLAEPSEVADAPSNLDASHGKKMEHLPLISPISKLDLYKELLMLDELHERGVLTDEEFEEEKKELLKKN